MLATCVLSYSYNVVWKVGKQFGALVLLVSVCCEPNASQALLTVN